MESNKTFRIIVITVSTLVTILTPVESKCVPLSDSFVAKSLLPIFPPSDSESPSPAPVSGSEITTPITAPPTDSPAASPGAPADSISPTNPPTSDSPAASPDSPADSVLLAKPTAEIDVDSPSPSPCAPANSISPTNSPTASPDAPASFISPANPQAEIDMDSPSPSPESPADSVSPPVLSTDSPADSVSPTNPPSVAPSTAAPSGKTLMDSPKSLLKQPLLSPEIKTICGKTDHPPLCESSVTPLLTAESKTDASSVLVLAIQASINATKAAMPTVNKVAAADCQELYDSAVTNLEDAVNAVKSGDIATVNSNLSAAMTDYSTCNDGFEETGEPNPLADVGDKLTKMVSNCLAISSLIK